MFMQCLFAAFTFITIVKFSNNILIDFSDIIQSGFKPVSIGDGTANLSVTVALASSDVTPVRDQILLITNNNITVSMVDTFGTGTSTTGGTSSTTSGATAGGTSGSGGSGSSY